MELSIATQDKETIEAIKRSLEDIGPVTAIKAFKFGSSEVWLVEAKGKIQSTGAYREESHRILEKDFLSSETTDVLVVDNGWDYPDATARFVFVFGGA